MASGFPTTRGGAGLLGVGGIDDLTIRTKEVELAADVTGFPRSGP